MQKTRYRVNGKSFIIKTAAVLMYLSAIFRLLACWGPVWKGASVFFIITQVALPVICNVMFAVIIVRFGEKHFTLTLVPVLLGVVFFVIKATDMTMLSMLLCMVVSILTAVVYTSTVLGGLESKWFLPPLFGVPLLYQLIFRDGATILVKEDAMTLGEFIPELSVLCILLSLLLTSFAMNKVKNDDVPILEGEEVMEEEPVAIEDKTGVVNEAAAEAEKTENSQEEKQL